MIRGNPTATSTPAVYSHVPNIDEMFAAVESKGGKRAFGPFPIPDGSQIAGVTDPEGNLIGLVQAAPGM